jgi:4-carboxymuconolactone decarboxylase
MTDPKPAAYHESPRVPTVDRADFPAEQVGVYDHIMETRKLAFMPTLFTMMGNSPGALAAVASVGEHVRFHCTLDETLRELVICHVSKEVGNWYEWCHHIFRMPERLQKIVGTRDVEDEPAPVGPALRFARLTANRQPVDDALIAELKSHLGDIGLVELTVMVGYYQLIGTFCTVLQVPNEPQVKRVPFND